MSSREIFQGISQHQSFLDCQTDLFNKKCFSLKLFFFLDPSHVFSRHFVNPHFCTYFIYTIYRHGKLFMLCSHHLFMFLCACVKDMTGAVSLRHFGGNCNSIKHLRVLTDFFQKEWIHSVTIRNNIFIDSDLYLQIII